LTIDNFFVGLRPEAPNQDPALAPKQDKVGVVGLGRLTLSRRERMVVVELRGTGKVPSSPGDLTLD
jgi:hypothetical protein